jgi:hypothetical protein
MPPEARLATHMTVSSLVRQMAAQGDFATVLHKGDPIAGSLLLVTRCKGENPRLFDRFPQLSGGRIWQEIATQTTDIEQYVNDYCSRMVARDPDIWIVELDVAFPERLTGLLTSTT